MAEEVVRIMSTSGAQRRGKPLEPKPTILVESGGVLGRQEPPPIATVKRNSCGTGPFDRHWLNLDCCGLFCAGFTYMLHCYGVYAVCVVLIPPWMSTTDPESSVRSLSVWGLFHQVAFPLVAILAVIAHFKAMTTDPGAVPPDAKPLKEEEEEEKQDEYERLLPEDPLQPPPKPRKGHRLCRRCKSYKPQRAHHCSVCRRCIIKMDHHCPWVNNCVGIGNHKFFLLFVFYTFLSCIYSMTLVILRFMTCMGARGPHHQRQHVTCLDRPSDLLYILGLLVESLLFGMFTCCMMFDQSEVIRSKVTHIDRLKGLDVGGALSGVAEVFGTHATKSGCRCDWINPFVKACIPDAVVDEVMGFCRPQRRQRASANETELPARLANLKKVAEIV